MSPTPTNRREDIDLSQVNVALRNRHRPVTESGTDDQDVVARGLIDRPRECLPSSVRAQPAIIDDVSAREGGVHDAARRLTAHGRDFAGAVALPGGEERQFGVQYVAPAEPSDIEPDRLRKLGQDGHPPSWPAFTLQEPGLQRDDVDQAATPKDVPQS